MHSKQNSHGLGIALSPILLSLHYSRLSFFYTAQPYLWRDPPVSQQPALRQLYSHPLQENFLRIKKVNKKQLPFPSKRRSAPRSPIALELIDPMALSSASTQAVITLTILHDRNPKLAKGKNQFLFTGGSKCHLHEDRRLVFISGGKWHQSFYFLHTPLWLRDCLLALDSGGLSLRSGPNTCSSMVSGKC